MFGLAGSSNLELISAFQAAGGRYHAACHEAGAVAMADGWAQASGGAGLATVHQGPGLTNALTALVDSAKARTPLLLIAGEAEGGSAQWIDQPAILDALGTGLAVHRLAAGEAVAEVLPRLLRHARCERRPVVLLAPADVQVELTKDGGANAVEDRGWDQCVPVAPSLDDVAALARRLGRARRPAIVAGRGAVLAGAGPELAALADRLGAILTTTAPAAGLFAGHPYASGIAGGFASPLTTRLLGEADVVLVAGASLSPWTTCHGKLFAQAVVERIDVDGDAAGVSVVGDVGLVTTELLRRLPRPDDGRTIGWRSEELREQIGGRRGPDVERPATGDGLLDPAALCAELDRRLPPARSYVLDSGHFAAWPAMLSSVSEGGAFLFGQAFQAVGLGLARAIGAALGRPDRLTAALIGDGGAMMSLTELDTAVRLEVPLLVVVFDDAAYGAEVHDFEPLGVGVDAARFPDRDLAAIARAMGSAAVTATSPGDLDAIGEWWPRARGPLLVDVKVDPHADAVSLMTPLGAADWAPAPRPIRRHR
jgi:thiamine pyrophosphate-dependent acetolactate synthase large subunit-like protein